MWHSTYMPRAYSLALRERLVRAIDAGLAPGEIERTMGISRRTQRRWRQRRAATGDLTPRTSPGRPSNTSHVHRVLLQTQVEQQAEYTLAQHCAAFAQATSIDLSPATMCRTLARLGLSLKKRA
jgi:transposase